MSRRRRPWIGTRTRQGSGIPGCCACLLPNCCLARETRVREMKEGLGHLVLDLGLWLVGVTGFEPMASSSRTRSTWIAYIAFWLFMQARVYVSVGPAMVNWPLLARSSPKPLQRGRPRYGVLVGAASRRAGLPRPGR